MRYKYKAELSKDVVKFILILSIKFQVKIQRGIDLLKEFGYALPEPYSKKIVGIRGLYELIPSCVTKYNNITK